VQVPYEPRSAHIEGFQAAGPHRTDLIGRLIADAYQWDVFISHAGRDADKPFASQLWTLLDKPGIGLRVFLDECSLCVAADPRLQMATAMNSSRVGLLLLSREFFQRTCPKEELAALLDRKDRGRIRLLPVFLRMTTEQCTTELETAFPGGFENVLPRLMACKHRVALQLAASHDCTWGIIDKCTVSWLWLWLWLGTYDAQF
jgi:hypothetical protein